MSDNYVQSHYGSGVNSSSATAAGAAEGARGSYIAPKQANETESDYRTRERAAQDARKAAGY